MKPIQRQTIRHHHRGFASVIAVLFLVSVVAFILARSAMVSGGKSLESQLQFDSVAAQALAESGLEVGLAKLTAAINLDDSTFSTSCADLPNGSAVTVGRGTFQFVTSNTAITNIVCPIRVKGTVNEASRTLESQITSNAQIGTAGYGTQPSMTLKNPYNVPAAAVFNLAWRRQGSTGNSPPGGQASATSCTLASCGQQWNLESSSGLNSVGSLGTSLSVAANTTVQVNQTLDSPRNYTEVGLILGGLSTTPVLKGSYFDSKETTNTSNLATTTGTTTSGEAKGWCTGADTLVFGVSGRANDDTSAQYTSVMFNTNGTPAQPINMTWVSHYPNTDGTSPNAFGDVFSEIWYTYNPYIKMTSASSSGTTVTVASTTGLQVGTILKVYSGTGALAAYTKVSSVTNGTSFVIDQTPTTALSNAVLCGGICALFDNPSSSAAKTTTFSLTRSSSAAQQWAGGFVCFSGVDKTKVRRVSTSSVRKQLWHEVVTGE